MSYVCMGYLFKSDFGYHSKTFTYKVRQTHDIGQIVSVGALDHPTTPKILLIVVINTKANNVPVLFHVVVSLFDCRKTLWGLKTGEFPHTS